MFFDRLLGIELLEGDDIKANIVNIFNQRSSASLSNYTQLLSSKESSIYRYYGIVDIIYVNEGNIEKYVEHVKLALKTFETRVKEVSIDAQLTNLVVTLEIYYVSYSGLSDNLRMQIARR